MLYIYSVFNENINVYFIQTVMSVDGNRLIQKQSDDKGFESTLTRVFEDEQMTLTCQYKDIKSVRTYKKIE